jgi:hypothetical protein
MGWDIGTPDSDTLTLAGRLEAHCGPEFVSEGVTEIPKANIHEIILIPYGLPI